MIINMLFIVVFGSLAVTSSVVAVKIWRQGPQEISRLRRIGYGWRAARTGEMPYEGFDCSISTRTGILFSAKGGKIVNYRKTRTLTNGSL